MRDVGRAASIGLVIAALLLACGRDVSVGRLPDAALAGAGGQAGTGGAGDGGDGGTGGHDECAEDEPVCSTDHVTYMNLCLLLRAGARLDYPGVCR